MATDKRMENDDPELEREMAKMLALVFLPTNRHKLDQYIERMGELLANAEKIRQQESARDFEQRIAAVREV